MPVLLLLMFKNVTEGFNIEVALPHELLKFGNRNIGLWARALEGSLTNDRVQ